MYLIIIGKIVLFIGFERGLVLLILHQKLIKNIKKTNNPRRESVPGAYKVSIGQNIVIK